MKDAYDDTYRYFANYPYRDPKTNEIIKYITLHLCCLMNDENSKPYFETNPNSSSMFEESQLYNLINRLSTALKRPRLNDDNKKLLNDVIVLIQNDLPMCW